MARQAWVVYVNADLTEGRGPMMIRALFENKADADRWALTQEPYGSAGQFTRVESMVVFDAEAAARMFEDYKQRDRLRAEKEQLEERVRQLDRRIKGLI